MSSAKSLAPLQHGAYLLWGAIAG